MVLKLKDDIESSDWISLLENNPNANIFQTPEFFSTQHNNTGVQPFIFGVYDNDNLVGVVSGTIISNGVGIIKKLTSRAVIIGGPLFSINLKNRTEVLSLLLNGIIKKLKKKTVFIQ